MRMLIVDGYNVIHRWASLAAVLRSHGLEPARDRLVATLSDYAAASGVAVTVVFDAHQREGTPTTSQIEGVTVRFGTAKQSADHLIERLAFEATRAGAARDMVVATDDRLQANLVVAMGVSAISVDGLALEVARVAAETAAAGAAHGRGEAMAPQRVEERIDAAMRARLDALRRGRRDPGADG